MRHGRVVVAAAALAGTLVLLCAPRPAAVRAADRTEFWRAQQQPVAAPTLKVYSRETLVDVLATDKNGKPVRGLQPSDFTVTEDGKPQAIRSFAEFDPAVPQPRQSRPTPPRLPPNVYTNLQPADGDGPLNIFMFDFINGGGNYFAAHKEDVTDFLKRLPAGTRTAVVGIASQLVVIQSPTTDSALLPRAITTVLDPMQVSGDPCTILRERIYATLRELDQIADYVSGIKGRKNLIWINQPPAALVWPNPCQDFTEDIHLTYNRLAEAEVAIDPLDPHGVQAPIVGPAGAITANTGAQVAAGQMQVQTEIASRHLTMEGIAEATGGEAFYNNNDRNGLIVKAIDGGAHYYTLSYVPRIAAYDGRLHSIHITIKKSGVQLVYRTAYSAEDPTVAVSRADPAGPKQMRVAMGTITPPATQLLFDVSVEPSIEAPLPSDPPILGVLNPKLSKQPLTRYGLLFAIPSSEIAFSGSDSRTYSGSLEFDVAAFDPDGRLVTMRSQTMRLPLNPQEYGDFVKTPFQFYQQLDLPPGQFTLRAGVLDSTSNKIGTIDIPLTVGKTTPHAKD